MEVGTYLECNAVILFSIILENHYKFVEYCYNKINIMYTQG